MVVSRRGKIGASIPPILHVAERVASMRVLGVTLRQDLQMSSHIDSILASCSSSMYALKVLRSHGLTASALQIVTQSTAIAQLMYASPAWWVYTKAEEGNRIEQQISRMKHQNYLSNEAKSAEALAQLADKQLFSSIVYNEYHVLYSLLPQSILPVTHSVSALMLLPCLIKMIVILYLELCIKTCIKPSQRL